MSFVFSTVPKHLIRSPHHTLSHNFHSVAARLYPRSSPWKSLKKTAEDEEETVSKPWDYNNPSSSNTTKDLFAETLEPSKHEQFAPENNTFHVQRPFRTETDATTATEKERLIFTKILDSILYQRDKNRNRKSGSSLGGNSQRVSSSLQALFESNDNFDALSSSKSASPTNPSLFSRSNQLPKVKFEIATEDVRKVPLSYGSLIQKDSADETKKSKSLQAQQKEREDLISVISPILNHIENLQTDQEVINYYIQRITERFIPDSIASNPSPTPTPLDPLNPPLSKQYLPFYLVKCMSVLCTTFDDPSEAISLFEISKRVGIEFYACTCSVDVYNEMLQIRWEYFRDLYAVESLVSEMHVNAVQGNERTVDILGGISRDSIDAKHGILGINGVPLWTAEDDERVRKLNQYRLRITATLASLEGFTLPFVA